MEFLKDVLGEELYKQVAAKLTGNEKVKLANLADGGYVGKDKFEALGTTNKNLEGQLKDRDKQLKKLAGVDVDDMQKTIKNLQADNKTQKESHDKDILSRDRSQAISEVLSGSGAKNPKAVRGMLDDTKIVYSGGQVAGIKEQIDALKESDDYLFNPPEKQVTNPSGTKKPDGADSASVMNDLIRGKG